MNIFKRYLFFVSIFLSVVLFFLVYTMQDKLKREERVFKNFRNQSKALVLLKEKWNHGKDYKKIFARLRAIAKPVKDISKGVNHIFEYENLSQVTLKRVLQILFNSNLVIKELTIEKSRKKISLHVEVIL